MPVRLTTGQFLRAATIGGVIWNCIIAHNAMAQAVGAPLPNSDTRASKDVPTNDTGCLKRLSILGAEFARGAVSSAAIPSNAASGTCVIKEPVVLTAINIAGQSPSRISFPSKPLLSCEMAEQFGHFIGTVAAPLARGIFSKPLESVETGPGFECRPRNRQAGAKMSSHAQGDAVDISAITLAGKETHRVVQSNNSEAKQFFAALRTAGCGAFSTVLGPGSDMFHNDHLHFDIEKRGRDGKSKFCQ